MPPIVWAVIAAMALLFCGLDAVFWINRCKECDGEGCDGCGQSGQRA